MPGRRAPEKPQDQNLCRRCQDAGPVIVVRTEPLCKDCFSRYVQSKVVKRMESFRVRHSDPGNERRLLLPLSLDPCSIALVHILSQHLDGQAGRTGRTGFKLCVLYVNDDPSLANQASPSLEELKTRYPEHEYHTADLSSVLHSDDLASLFSEPAGSADAPLLKERMREILDSPTSATSRQDLRQIIKRRLVVDFAKDNRIEAIIWTDSTTRLAERTIAETAKGRGFTLPWIMADGESPHGVAFYFPLRELLSKEVESYVSFLEPSLTHLVRIDEKPSVSTKHSTIDDLMKQYFESVEQDYPSIVANVVRTTGKLQSTPLSGVEQQCELCDMPLEGHAPEKSRLCYGCIRTLPQTSS